MEDLNAPPTAPQNVEPTPAPENSTIKAMREQIDAKNAELKSLQTKTAELEAAKLTAERAKLDETERLRLEADDAKKQVNELSSHKATSEKLTAALEKACETELAKLSDAQKAAIEKVAAYVPISERLDVIREQAALFAPVTAPAGTVTNAGTRPGNPTAAPQDPKTINWADAVKQHTK